MAADVAVLPMRAARPETVSARNRLIDAMDLVEMTGGEIPCKTDPEGWTSDLFAYSSGRGRYLAALRIDECLDCPVLAECARFADEAKRSRSTVLYGVVGARLVIANKHIEIDPREA